MSLRLDKESPFHSNSMILSRQLMDKKELKSCIKYHLDVFFKKESRPQYINTLFKRLEKVLKEDFNKKRFQVYAVDPTMVFTFQKINSKDDVKDFNLASFIDIEIINGMKA